MAHFNRRAGGERRAIVLYAETSPRRNYLIRCRCKLRHLTRNHIRSCWEEIKSFRLFMYAYAYAYAFAFAFVLSHYTTKRCLHVNLKLNENPSRSCCKDVGEINKISKAFVCLPFVRSFEFIHYKSHQNHKDLYGRQLNGAACRWRCTSLNSLLNFPLNSHRECFNCFQYLDSFVSCLAGQLRLLTRKLRLLQEHKYN